jgi:ubiquinone/menaquinone biosynthesis C-methylase UbiE
MPQKIDLKDIQISCVKYYAFLNQDYFNKYADELEKKPYDLDFLNRFAGQIEKNGKVLDIGCCSTAQQARFLKNRGFQVISIDLSAECIASVKHRFPGIDFRQMDMLQMNFDNESFSAINAFYSIIHIPDEKLDQLFYDFNRILKLHGKIAIAVHAGDYYGYFTENEIPVFYRTFQQTDLKDLLSRHGFSIIEINQRLPIYDFEFKSERIYLTAEKIG